MHFCEWQGITCSHRHRRVILLNLNSRGLIGTLSPYIGNLSFLRQMHCADNILQSRIPQEIGSLFRLEILNLSKNSLEGDIPSGIGSLFRLKTLDLSLNSLEGEIPSNLSQCINLMQLGLGNNNLTGNIPPELSTLTQLKRLAIHYNFLRGRIPLFIGNLTVLETLSAASNMFTGSIPNSFGHLKSLKFLGFGKNELSGKIPSSIYNLSIITTISLPWNQLQGNLPHDLGVNLPNLRKLEIWGNQFTGSIPVSLSNASRLEFLDMGINHFSGKLPTNFGGLNFLWKIDFSENNLGGGDANDMSIIDDLTNCSSLQVLKLEINRLGGKLPNSVGNLSNQFNSLFLWRNQLFGEIPPSVGNLLNLRILSLRNNLLTGSIPVDICKLQKLAILSLGFNKLSGKIPPSLGNLTQLITLRLEYNKLNGPIPSSIGGCRMLSFLNITANNLNGTIPRQLFSIFRLSVLLDLSQNSLFGSLPPEIGNLVNLNELDLSENKLSGGVPGTLGSCTSLEILNLRDNFLQGSLPPSLSTMEGVRKLDISRNNLSGTIPNYLVNFDLIYLNLSFNDFEGEVPTEGAFRNRSAITVVGNNRLCGGIPELQLPKCPKMKRKKGNLSLALTSTILIFLVLVGVSTAIFFLSCWFKKKNKVTSVQSLPRQPFMKMSYKMLLKATGGFSSSNLIGTGSFGSVYKGILEQDEKIIAVKVLNLQHGGAFRSFMTECKALRGIRHRNLLKILSACSSVDYQVNDFKAIVYEYMPNGSLEKWLHPYRELDDYDELQSLNLIQRINVAIDVACALDYLHNHCENGIVHCDLKPSNILLNSDMTAHVGDFGLAKFLSDSCESSSIGFRGTIGYTPPEYGLGSDVSTYGDIYSYGIVLLEMMTRKRPTDSLFKEGLNLHNFVEMALPDRALEIADPILLNYDREGMAFNNDRQRLGREENKMGKCLASLLNIGVACSMEMPRDRMDISAVIKGLNSVRDVLVGT